MILSTQPEQVPVLAYYFGDDLRYATPLDADADTRVMDWRDAVRAPRDGEPEETLDPVLDAVPPGGHLLVVLSRVPRQRPVASTVDEPGSSAKRTVADEDLGRPAVHRTQEYTPPYTGRRPPATRREVYEKTDGG